MSRDNINLEKINLLEEAQLDINNAIRKIRKALKGTNRESYTEMYIIGHLDNWANADYTGDTNIPALMEEFYNEEIS